MIPKILKGDDTNANGKSITITYPAGQYVGLRLEFAFLGHKKVSANLDKHGGSFTIDFTAEQTKVMPLGTHFASMALLDSADRRYTITNTLKLLVTDDVAFAYDGESNNISLDVTVTGGIPDLSDVNTAPQTPNALVNSFKEVVDRLNAARPVLASALLSLASLCAFGFGVTPKTAPLGDVKFTDGVVTGVTFSSDGLLIDNAQMLTNSANFRLAVKATVPSVDGAAEIATNAAKYIAASASITNAGAVAYADTLVSNKVDKTQNKNGLTYQLPAYSVLCPVRNTGADEWYEAYFDVGTVQYVVGCDVGHYVSSHNGYADDYLYIIPKYVKKNAAIITITATNCLYYTMSARSGAIEVHGEVCSNAVLNVGAIQSDPVMTIPDNLVRYIKPKITLVSNALLSYYKVEFCGFTANNVQNGVPGRDLKCNTPLAELAISGNFTTEPTISDYVSGVLWNSSVLPTVFERYFIQRCLTTPISLFINNSGYQTEVQTRGIVSNVVTRAYVEDLGISSEGVSGLFVTNTVKSASITNEGAVASANSYANTTFLKKNETASNSSKLEGYNSSYFLPRGAGMGWPITGSLYFNIPNPSYGTNPRAGYIKAACVPPNNRPTLFIKSYWDDRIIFGNDDYNSNLYPDGSDILTKNSGDVEYVPLTRKINGKSLTEDITIQSMDYQAITNTVNSVKEQFYDQPLQVNWTMRMVNGEMKLYATTNTNQSVLQ